MAISIQFPRGDKAKNDALTAALASFSVDTESKNVRVHDGATAGGLFVLASVTYVDAKVAALVGAAPGALDTLAELAAALGADANYAASVTTALAGKAPLTHVGAGGTAHAAATTSVAGFMSAAAVTKLAGIADGANNYAHPTGDGNTHVPVTGTSSNTKVLKAGSTAGSVAWGQVLWGELGNVPATFAPAAHSHGVSPQIATSTGNGSATTVTLPLSNPGVLVFVGGCVQPPTAYAVSGTVLTLTEAPEAGVLVQVLCIPASI